MEAETRRPTAHEPIYGSFFIGLAGLFGAWALISLLGAALSLQYGGNQRQLPGANRVGLYTLYWLSWAALTPVILRFARHFHWDWEKRWRLLIAHLGCAAVIAPLQVLLYTGSKFLLAFGFGATPSSPRLVLALLSFLNIPVYFAIVALYNAFAYYQMYHRERSATSELRARLAEAELAALRMQLQPHFLFNTLNAISVLMTEDVKKADRMLVRLSELLRLTLDSSGRQYVSLKQELEFLERYLDIERIRFADRLQVQFDVEPATLDARVPNLILQPLVENAIRHGIAPRAEGGQLDFHARRRNGKLELEVHDDGPGMGKQTAPSDARRGIGLANCEARLAQLYGAEHRFEHGASPDGGFSVVLKLPFETAPTPIESRT
jgi:signal transduction histidine kinase